MIDGGGGRIIAIFTGLFTVAIVAVIVSQRAQTAQILQALGSATGSALGAAVSPVTNNGPFGGQ